MLWCLVFFFLGLFALRVRNIRRKIRDQIADNARLYIILHSYICPLQRRVHKEALARKRQRRKDGGGGGVGAGAGGHGSGGGSARRGGYGSSGGGHFGTSAASERIDAAAHADADAETGHLLPRAVKVQGGLAVIEEDENDGHWQLTKTDIVSP